MGSGASQVAGTFLALFIAKYTNRTVAGVWTLVLACIGCAMMLGIPASNNGARYGGYILVMQCNHLRFFARPTTNILVVPICVLFIITFITAGVAGSTKKIAFGAAYQLGYAVGNIIGPQTYRKDDAPNYYVSQKPSRSSSRSNHVMLYQIAKYTMLAFLIFTAILLSMFGLIHMVWNHKIDKRQADAEGIFQSCPTQIATINSLSSH